MINLQKIKCFFLFLLLFSCVQQVFSQENVRKISNLNASSDIVYFNLETGAAISPADTAKAGWDIAFQHTAITLQAKTSAQVVRGSNFELLKIAPAEGYQSGKAAIPTGSGNGWYSYNMQNHTISPIADRVIFIHTASGKYVKLAIESYYKDGSDGEAGNYTFRYAFIEPAK